MAFSPFKDQIKHFLSLAEHLNISKAAKELGLAQPQLTKSLQSLEHELDILLFERTNRGLVMTAQGKEFLSKANQMKSSWIQSFESSQNFGLFRVGCHPVIGYSYVPKILKVLSQHFPQMDVSYAESNSKEISHQISRGQFELGIAADPSRLNGLVLHQIAEDQVVLYQAGSATDTLVANPQMIQFSRYLKKSKYRRIVEVSDYDIAALTAIELGAACLLPSPLENRFPKLKRVKVVDRIPISLVYSFTNRSHPAIEKIKAMKF